ncbi:zincin [Melanomma pulvis-pyrius CBS 109.77]|uniref:Zincin n=1 Tax=Melanomma pulvis-pyrius CBS 109.77 TaxID=1314802 RepID=A0A6A6XG54_9PLEO|nr:zincin [Melanomma pulvis-pyrius CBS 109.77]
MQIKNFLLSALAATGVVAKRSCGTPLPSDEQILVAQNLQLQEEAAGNDTFSIQAGFTVNIYYHVIARSTAVSAGYLTQATLTRQTEVLNAAYAPHGISFVQKGVDWTINTSWAAGSGDLAMKKALRKGTYSDLNIYFEPGQQYLGFAYFPQTITSTTSNAFYLDGVVILSTTVPGGSLAKYNLGHTATHEVGHWLGLYHTFEGYACTGNGDYVSDTPFESSEAYDCQIGRDTCPNASGADPVTNYMDYSDDSCFTGFTAGQEARINSYWTSYRG